jgi:hypothetical protein
MPQFNYSKICEDIFNILPVRQKEILERRFGIITGKKETLDSIGKDFNLTRERIRQIERESFAKMEKEKEKRELKKVFFYFENYLKENGGLKREDLLLDGLGGDKFNKHIYFLLTFANDFFRVSEDDKFYSFWTVGKEDIAKIENILKSILKKFEEIHKLLSEDEILKKAKQEPRILHSLLEVAKEIEQDKENNYYGLINWPEIKPKGVKDKAYLVFKREKEPLHFTNIAKLINNEAHAQTVHNELIKDDRFVLIGRGIYALKEWGYENGTVKEVISKVLEEAKNPMSKEELLKKVQNQRLVKENTILLNLSNGEYFIKDKNGNYSLKDF